jgi:outer membrane biosynthesis protein TonB
MPRAKKAKVSEPAPEPEEVEEPEEEEEEEEDTENNEDNEEEEEEEAPEGEDNAKRVKRLKRSRVNERRKARQNGYRSYANMAGAGVGNASFGNDLVKSIFSPSDIRRLATWCPSTGDVHMSLAEFETHLSQRDESLSSGPLKVLGANVESFARKIVTELVMRNVESKGSQTISAANVKSVLRPFVGALHSADFLSPGGIVRIAQQTAVGDDFVLPTNEDEDAAITEERKFAKSNQVKLLKEKDKAKEAAMTERKRKRAEKAAQKEGATALATGAA